MGQHHARSRKKLFIDPVVQGALLRRLLLHWTYAMLAGGMTLLMMQVFLNGVDKPLAFHLTALWNNYGVLFVIMVCLFPAFAYDSVKLSHRFAGPIFALRSAMRTLADGGTISEVAFRRGDYWTELAADLNRLAARYHQLKITDEPSDSSTSPAAGEAPSRTEEPVKS